jgi:hypothetical protein
VTVRPWLIAAAILVALGAGWLHGRSTAPTRTVTTTSVLRVVRTVEVASKQQQAEQHDEHVEGKERIVTKWRTAASKQCEPTEVVRVEYREVERETKAALLATSESKTSLTSSNTHHESVQLVERERPRYAVGVDGAIMFSDATALVRGNFSVRAIGPLWITAFADKRSAGAGARLEF